MPAKPPLTTPFRNWTEFGRIETSKIESALEASALLMIDIDHFKSINDRFGHITGDHALVVIAQTLASCLRPQDLLARFGGEEFTVLLPGLETASAVSVAERLRAAVAKLPPLTGATATAGTGDHTITVSIGVATAMAATTVAALLARADAALYRAKGSGRNRVESETGARG